MLCCLAVQLQGLAIGVTTKDPDSRLVTSQVFRHMPDCDQNWDVIIRNNGCRACQYRSRRTRGRHHQYRTASGLQDQYRELHRVLDYSAGNTFGCHVSGTGELHLHHNGRDVGVAWEGLPTDQTLWGVVEIGGLKVEANYVIPKREAVWCDVVCGVMFVSLYVCTC